MSLTDWIIVLAVALLSIAFYCGRIPVHWSPENRARRATGVRLLVQATLAVWAALIIIGRDLLSAEGALASQFTAHTLVIAVFGLMVCGAYWSLRANRLLKPRRIFSVR